VAAQPKKSQAPKPTGTPAKVMSEKDKQVIERIKKSKCPPFFVDTTDRVGTGEVDQGVQG